MKCKDCGNREIDTSRSSRCCTVCLDGRAKSQKKYNKVGGKARKQKLLNSKKCVICGSGEAVAGTLCTECSIKSRKLSKKRREEFPKKVQEGQKRSMAKKPELYKHLKHLTYLRHKDDWYRQRGERRARLSNCEGSYTQTEWIELMNKYGNKCLQCGSPDNLEADHVVPIVKGGRNSIDNIQPLCRHCNRSKWTKILDFRPFGRAILDWT
jgi:5-methylcytosine-specific restriction endonuclease McrA